MVNTNERLRIIYGDETLGVQGKDFHYIFSYLRGGPESLVIDGRQWLYREMLPTFWRATTDNDRGNDFSKKSIQWLGTDMFIDVTSIAVSVDDKSIELPHAPNSNKYSPDEYAEKLSIIYKYKTITIPATAVTVAYSVNVNGDLNVHAHYTGNKELPDLPVFGMRMIIPTLAKGYSYEGFAGETYPDRLAGAAYGIYNIDGVPVTPYLVPQECGMHMQTKWVKIDRDTVKNNADRRTNLFSIRISSEDSFAFSCLPYTAEELENATHMEELPVARRTVLCILGKVRGVGGIDSWGRDVEAKYHILAAEDIDFSFKISGD